MIASLLLAGALLGAAHASPTPVVTVRDTRITESSGLVVSPTHRDLVWTINDSGSAAVVYGVSTRTGRTVAVLSLAGTDARDTESMTATTRGDGRGLLWIGDTGDNNRVRESVVLRLVVEPRTVASASVHPVSLRVRYPGGPADVETMLWTRDGDLLLVTKELFAARVLQVPRAAVDDAIAGVSTATPVLAREVATVSQSLVTDGAGLPDGRIVLRGYGDATVYAAPSDAQMQALDLVGLPSQAQGETFAVERDGRTALVGSEGVRQKIWRVSLPVAAAPESPSVATTSSAAETAPVSHGDSGDTLWAGALLVGAVSLVAVTGARRRGRRRR